MMGYSEQQKRQAEIDAAKIRELKIFVFEACKRVDTTTGIIAFADVLGILVATMTKDNPRARAKILAIAKSQIDLSIKTFDQHMRDMAVGS